MLRLAAALLIGTLSVAGCSADSDRSVPTSFSSTTTPFVTGGTTSSSAQTTVQVVRADQGHSCAREAFALDLGVPVMHVRGEPECVAGYALARVCRAEDETCPEGYLVLAAQNGRWTRIGHSLQTCVEGLVAQGVTADVAMQFKGFHFCFARP